MAKSNPQSLVFNWLELSVAGRLFACNVDPWRRQWREFQWPVDRGGPCGREASRVTEGVRLAACDWKREDCHGGNDGRCKGGEE